MGKNGLKILCDMVKKNAITIFQRYQPNDISSIRYAEGCSWHLSTSIFRQFLCACPRSWQTVITPWQMVVSASLVGFKKTSPLVSHSAITFDATFSEILQPVGPANVGSASLKERVLINLAFLHAPEIGDVDTSDGDQRRVPIEVPGGEWSWHDSPRFS